MYFWAAIVAVCLAGIYICGKAAKDSGVHDHGAIVWDEIAGYLITMAIVPSVHIYWALIGFAVFRFFDILKPFPINICDKYVKGGLGIMLDDILAGFAAMAVMYGIYEFYKTSIGL
jgi:phosphatidylglycerophosphatase A